jgi:hypothetical protein
LDFRARGLIPRNALGRSRLAAALAPVAADSGGPIWRRRRLEPGIGSDGRPSSPRDCRYPVAEDGASERGPRRIRQRASPRQQAAGMGPDLMTTLRGVTHLRTLCVHTRRLFVRCPRVRCADGKCRRASNCPPCRRQARYRARGRSLVTEGKSRRTENGGLYRGGSDSDTPRHRDPTVRAAHPADFRGWRRIRCADRRSPRASNSAPFR